MMYLVAFLFGVAIAMAWAGLIFERENHALRKRLEAAETTIVGLRFDIGFWRQWAVQAYPQLRILAAEQHITDDDIEAARGLVAALAKEPRSTCPT